MALTYSKSGQVTAAVKAAMANSAWQPPASLPQVGRAPAVAKLTAQTLLTPNQLAVAVCGAGITRLHAYAQGVRGYSLRSSGQRAAAHGGQWAGLTVAQWRQAFGYAAVHTTATDNKAQAAHQRHNALLTKAQQRASGQGATSGKRQAQQRGRKATPAPVQATPEPTVQATPEPTVQAS